MRWAKTYTAIRDTLIAALFGGLISLPLLLALTEADKIYSETERRFLTEFPSVSFDRTSLAGFARRFDAYYQDHFGLREWLIRRYHREVSKRFRGAPLPDVVVGRDGWYFYSGEGVLDDITGRLRLEPEQLEQLSEEIRTSREWLQQQDIFYLFAVAPNKQSIYPELLPDHISRGKKESRLDQAVAALNGGGESLVIDLRPVLTVSRERKRLYDKTDTHWNSLGAYIAYRELMKHVRHHFPGHDFADNFTVGAVWREEPAGDLARFSGRESDTRELRPMVNAWIRAREKELSPQLRKILALKNLQPVHTVRKGRQLRALVLHDSFLNPMRPFLSESFGEVLSIWKYFDRESESYFNRDRLRKVIDEFQPDIVIELIVERHLDWLIPEAGLTAAAGGGQGKNFPVTVRGSE